MIYENRTVGEIQDLVLDRLAGTQSAKFVDFDTLARMVSSPSLMLH
jgi:hypothetical protein